MNEIRQFDQRLLKDGMFGFILLTGEVIHVFLWLRVSVWKLEATVGWSLGLLFCLMLIELYELLFQLEDGKLSFIYDKIKYYPVARSRYWLCKLVLLGRTALIHCLTAAVAGFLAYICGIW